MCGYDLQGPHHRVQLPPPSQEALLHLDEGQPKGTVRGQPDAPRCRRPRRALRVHGLPGIQVGQLADRGSGHHGAPRLLGASHHQRPPGMGMRFRAIVIIHFRNFAF